MSLSSAIQEEKIYSFRSEMNNQTNVDGPLHLVDPSVHYDTVNALAFDQETSSSEEPYVVEQIQSKCNYGM